MGTISCIDLRRHYPDLMASKGRSLDKALIDRANLVALDREVRAALELAAGRGAVVVNVMRAVSEYPVYVRRACESGAQAIVVSAGLPLDLPDLAAEHPGVALVPILSDARGVSLLLRKWQRQGHLPDALVIEHPRYAGGHLGAAQLKDVSDPRFDFESVLEAVFQVFTDLGVKREGIPLIPAGGINSHARLRELLGLGAGAVQLGTASAVGV